jgi:hypothetical protein
VFLRIEVACREDDRDWLRARIVPAVETEVDVATSEGRVDINTEVTWEYEP